MKKFKNTTLKDYLGILSKKEPVPGGGSAAAYSAALAVGLISMVGAYSKGKGQPKRIEAKIARICEQSKLIREQLLDLVDLDAQAYLNVVKAKNKSKKEKQQANKKAQKIPLEVCRLTLKAVDLIPYLVIHGNKYLISDLSVAGEMLLAAHRSAAVLYHSNS